MVNSGEKKSALVEVGFETVPATALLADKPDLRTHRPYDCVTSITLRDDRLELPSIVPADARPEAAGVEYRAMLSQDMTRALRAYVYSRYKTSPESRPVGNCHEFVCFLAGLDTEYKHATRTINNIFSLVADTPVASKDLHVPLGNIVTIGHPTHVMVGPPVSGQRHPDYGEHGHGPLIVQHSAISIGVVQTNPSEIRNAKVSYLLQRMSLRGPLGITSLPDTLREYKEFVPTLDSASWLSGPPQSDNICHYSYPPYLIHAA